MRTCDPSACALCHLEERCIEWFREAHVTLIEEIRNRFIAAEPHLPSASDLLCNLPRNAARAQHLLRAAELPAEAFQRGSALEMLCCLTLQTLPCNSRTYVNLYPDEDGHSGAEKQCVRNVMCQHHASCRVPSPEYTGEHPHGNFISALCSPRVKVATFTTGAEMAGANVRITDTNLVQRLSHASSRLLPCAARNTNTGAAASSGTGAQHVRVSPSNWRRETAASTRLLEDLGVVSSYPDEPVPAVTDAEVPLHMCEELAGRLGDSVACLESTTFDSSTKGKWNATRQKEAPRKWMPLNAELVAIAGWQRHTCLCPAWLCCTESRREEKACGGLENGDTGWVYEDDFGHEQGPFSTKRICAWLQHGYLTSSRPIRPANGNLYKCVSEWSALEVIRFGQPVGRQSPYGAHAATAVPAHQGSTSFPRTGVKRSARVQQQHFVRSSFGFDALLMKVPSFQRASPEAWPLELLDALRIVVDLAAVDVLSHLMGRCNSNNLSMGMVVELVSLGFWFVRPGATFKGGQRQHESEKLRVAVQRQWALVVQRLCVWHRSLTVHAYWQLASASPDNCAAYVHALQFVDWSPTSALDAQNVAAYLWQQLGLARSLVGEAAAHHMRALTSTVEQLRLPMLPVQTSEHAMLAVQAWALHAIYLLTDAHGSAVQISAHSNASHSAKTKADSNLNTACRQLTVLEFATACIAQSSADFFVAQMPFCLHMIQPFIWAPSTVEAALHLVLRLLRGCYTAPQPYWTADERAAPGSRNLASSVVMADAQQTPTSLGVAMRIGRYHVCMHPSLSGEHHLVRLADVRKAVFPEFCNPSSAMVSEAILSDSMQRTEGPVVSELPHAHQLIEVLAEIVVTMAAHAVQWTIEQVIVPFLQSRKGSKLSAAYPSVAMRALALMLDPASEFMSTDVRMQRDVPMMLAPTIDNMLKSAHAQCGLQRVGIRYYPLPVAQSDVRCSEASAAQKSAYMSDFGPHPLANANADVRLSLSLAASAPLQIRSMQEEDTMDEEWKRHGAIQLVAYRGGGLVGGEGSTLKLSYARCFMPQATPERWHLSLDPRLVWTAFTCHAPARSLLAHETAVAHARYVAAVGAMVPEDGRTFEDWVQLYVFALGVLPLFDQSSLPSELVVNGRGRCFLVRALAHPDDRVACAAAHALQRIMKGHAALRVPLLRSLLALLGRVPEHDVAVRATTLAHFCHLIGVWIDTLESMDPGQMTTAALLEPVEPFLAKVEAEAMVAMGHPHPSVRLPAIDLLYEARRLGNALSLGHERMTEMVSGVAQEREQELDRQRRLEDLVRNETMIRCAKRRCRCQQLRPDESHTNEGRPATCTLAGHELSSQQVRSQRCLKPCAPSVGHAPLRCGGSRVQDRDLDTKSRMTRHGVTHHCSPRTCRSDSTKMALSQLARSMHTEEASEGSRVADREHACVVDQLQNETDLKDLIWKPGMRIVEVLDNAWKKIVAVAIQLVLETSGDYVLEASTFALPEQLTLRDTASCSCSVLWTAVLTAAIHSALDEGCAGFARLLRRTLRNRLTRLTPLGEIRKERPDSLIATLHINWGSMLFAATGRSMPSAVRSPVSLCTLRARVAEMAEQGRLQVHASSSLPSPAVATKGLKAKVRAPQSQSARLLRVRYHKLKLGTQNSEIEEIEMDTDEEDETYGLMVKVDLRLRQQLGHLHAPLRWVRQAVVLAISSIHTSSLVAVVHATVTMYRESYAKEACQAAVAQRSASHRKFVTLPNQQVSPSRDNREVSHHRRGDFISESSPALQDACANMARSCLANQQRIQRDLTQLMRLLVQHRGMAEAIDTCPELITEIATFVRQIGEALFEPAMHLLRTGQSHAGRHSLLELIHPEQLLPWCIDYLGLLGSFSDAICRRRELTNPSEFSSLMSGVHDALWSIDERYVLYKWLKLWSSHGTGICIRRGEELELSHSLSLESDPARRLQLAQSVEAGAQRRSKYAHWAISQLLSIGATLPLASLSETQIEEELAWAVDAERQSPFVLLRPLLAFHFDALLPIYFIHSRSSNMCVAALYQAALFSPVQLDHPETCIAIHYVRMTSVVANGLYIGRQKCASTMTYNTHASRETLVRWHERNVATIVFWGMLHLLAPEAAFRRDAAAALSVLAETIGNAGHDKPHATSVPVTTSGKATAAEGHCPTSDGGDVLLGASIVDLHLFWTSEVDSRHAMHPSLDGTPPMATPVLTTSHASRLKSMHSTATVSTRQCADASSIAAQMNRWVDQHPSPTADSISLNATGAAAFLAPRQHKGTRDGNSEYDPSKAQDARVQTCFRLQEEIKKFASSPPPRPPGFSHKSMYLASTDALSQHGNQAMPYTLSHHHVRVDPSLRGVAAMGKASISPGSTLDSAHQTVEQVVFARIGSTNGRVRNALDLHVFVRSFSKMLADCMPHMSAAVITEGGNLLAGVMDEPSCQFTLELLLPWAQHVALSQPHADKYNHTCQIELQNVGFCAAGTSICLQPVFTYTLRASLHGVPQNVLQFWRTLALAVPPPKPGSMPSNILPLTQWISAQAARTKDHRHTQTARSLELFVKGLAVPTSAELALLKTAESANKKGVAATAAKFKLKRLQHEQQEDNCARAVATVCQAAKQQRLKSTSQDLDQTIAVAR